MDTGNDARRCDEDQLAQFSWAKDVPAPVDADGKLVPLRTEKLYTDGGEEFSVDGIIYLLDERGWAARGVSKHSKRLCSHDLRFLHIAKPDSWERLLEDLDGAYKDEDFYSIACAYAGNERDACGDCKLRGSRGRCTRGMLEDIASRIRKLREEDDG